jgi:hypothetical protein
MSPFNQRDPLIMDVQCSDGTRSRINFCAIAHADYQGDPDVPDGLAVTIYFMTGPPVELSGLQARRFLRTLYQNVHIPRDPEHPGEED